MSNKDVIEQIMDLLNSQNGRGYVDQNTPMPADMFQVLQGASGAPVDHAAMGHTGMGAGGSGSISVESEGHGAGLYPAATLPESFGQVQSLMPEALSRGELNEQSIKDYTDALEIFNSGGKGEKIAGILAGLAGAGGYIADRTSGDIDRRNQASADLGPALQSLFSIPRGMRSRREGDLKSEFDRIDFERGLRGESIGARTTAKQTDVKSNLAFRQLEQKSAGIRAKAHMGMGAGKEPSQDDKNFKLGSVAFDRFRAANPTMDGGTALTEFRDSDPKHFAWMAKGNDYLTNYQSADELHTEAIGEISEIHWKRNQKRYDNAIDDEERAAIVYEINKGIERDMMSFYNIPPDKIQAILLRAGIDTSAPQGPPPEEPGFGSKAADAFVGATDFIGKVAGGDVSSFEGVLPGAQEDFDRLMSIFSGGAKSTGFDALTERTEQSRTAERQEKARTSVDELGIRAKGMIPDVADLFTPGLSDLSGVDPLMGSQVAAQEGAQEAPAVSAPISKGGEAIPHGDRVQAYAETAVKIWAEHQEEWEQAGNNEDARDRIEDKVTRLVEADLKNVYGLSPKQIELLYAENEELDSPSMYLEAIDKHVKGQGAPPVFSP